MSGGHDHSHATGGGTAASAQKGRPTAVLAITVSILIAEVVGGLLAHSLVFACGRRAHDR